MFYILVAINESINQIKESKQNKRTKETNEMLMNVHLTRPFVLKRGRPR